MLVASNLALNRLDKKQHNVLTDHAYSSSCVAYHDRSAQYRHSNAHRADSYALFAGRCHG